MLQGYGERVRSDNETSASETDYIPVVMGVDDCIGGHMQSGQEAYNNQR